MDIEKALRTAIGVARKHRFPIDDEAISRIGLAVAVAIKRWDSSLDTTFITYAVKLALNSLKKRERRVLQLDPYAPILGYIRSARAQQELLNFSEPTLSVCWSIWIERKKMADVCTEFNLTEYKVNQILEETSLEMRAILDDI